jgi:hypothetical protein
MCKYQEKRTTRNCLRYMAEMHFSPLVVVREEWGGRAVAGSTLRIP